jgi:hypothetical protein
MVSKLKGFFGRTGVFEKKKGVYIWNVVCSFKTKKLLKLFKFLKPVQQVRRLHTDNPAWHVKYISGNIR